MTQNPYSAEQFPQLNLAGADDGYPPNPANGAKVMSMPVPLPSIPREMPDLSTTDACLDMIQLGIDPTVLFDDLNLAGIHPLPAPPYDVPRSDNKTLAPTFYSPDFSVPPLQKGFDLVGPGIDWKPPMGVDPLLPDLQFYIQPLGAAVIVAASSDPMAIDPIAPDLAVYDRPTGLDMPGPLMVDPGLPDLKNPTLDQEVKMDARPGELADAALSIMHSNPIFKAVPSDDYEKLWMTQPGDNSRRERHLGMLMLGLDREEKGKVDDGGPKMVSADVTMKDVTGTDTLSPPTRGKRGRR